MSARDLFSLDQEELSGSDVEFEKGRSDVFKKKSKNIDESDSEDDLEDEVEMEVSENESDEDGNNDPLKEKKTKTLSKEEMEARLKQIKKSGVVYLSRVPPYMKPTKLRQILARFGEINRIFLSPEDPKAHALRVRAGGNKKQKYTEGWAEFVNKSAAKLAAETLNGNKIGGKKGSFYYDDIMNIKYLKRFKWTDLTEQIALEAQERQEKLKAEIAQATRENKIFIENVERKAMIDKIEAKKGKQEVGPVRKPFMQRSAIDKSENKKPVKSKSSSMEKVLSKVF